MANQALEAALEAVLRELKKADGMALQGGGVPATPEEAPQGSDGPEVQECQECAAGTCTDPDHMDDASLEEMAGGY